MVGLLVRSCDAKQGSEVTIHALSVLRPAGCQLRRSSECRPGSPCNIDIRVTGNGAAASHGGTVTLEEDRAITLARTGDQRAIAWLVGQYQHMVYTVTHRILRNDMDAEEATQDTFLKAIRGLHTFQGGSRFSTWLYSVAYRTAISRSRLRRTEDRSLDEVEGRPGEPGSEAQGTTSDRRRALEHALSRLTPEDAAVVTFHYLHEMSVDEIVTATGLSASNVKVKLHRSRKKMLEILQEHLKEEVWTLRTE